MLVTSQPLNYVVGQDCMGKPGWVWKIYLGIYQVCIIPLFYFGCTHLYITIEARACHGTRHLKKRNLKPLTMVRRPEVREDTRSFPALAVTIVLWAPETAGPWSAVTIRHISRNLQAYTGNLGDERAERRVGGERAERWLADERAERQVGGERAERWLGDERAERRVGDHCH